MPSNNEDDRNARGREIKRAYTSMWSAKNSAARAAYMKEWEAKNSEHRRAYREAYYEKNRERLIAESKARSKEWTEKNRERRLEIQRRYRERNREKLREAGRLAIRDASGELTAKYKSEHARKVRQRAIDLEALAGRPRPEVCDACGGPPDPKKGLHFDHCHKHGHFRGWLCRECNLALGNVRDDPARLLKLVAYLKRTARDAASQFALPGV